MSKRHSDALGKIVGSEPSGEQPEQEQAAEVKPVLNEDAPDPKGDHVPFDHMDAKTRSIVQAILDENDVLKKANDDLRVQVLNQKAEIEGLRRGAEGRADAKVYLYKGTKEKYEKALFTEDAAKLAIAHEGYVDSRDKLKEK